MTDKIDFTLDGKTVAADAGETIWDVAKREGTRIPHLCHVDLPGYRVDGNCRACMVEIDGERVLAASCIRKPTAGMDGQDRYRARREVARDGVRAAGEQHAAARCRPRQPGAVLAMGVVDGHRRQRALCVASSTAARGGRVRHLQSRHRRQPRCLHRLRRLRARLPRSAGQRRHRHGPIAAATTCPVFDIHDPMGLSTCVTCGECVQACPTGALYEKIADGQDGARSAPCRSSTRSSTRCVRSAASAARRASPSRTTGSSRSTAATATRTRTGCASKAASASTMRCRPSG